MLGASLGLAWSEAESDSVASSLGRGQVPSEDNTGPESQDPNLNSTAYFLSGLGQVTSLGA